jgi:glycosyltransferase involved in cell wall biosynthesis
MMPKTIHKSINTTGYPQNVKFMMKTNIFFKYLPNIVWLLLKMPCLVREYSADVYISTTTAYPFFLPRHVKKLILVHDVVHMEMTKTGTISNYLANIVLFNRSVRNADILWANSFYTRNKIDEYFPKRSCKNIFVGGGVDKAMFKNIGMSVDDKISLKESFGVLDRFALFVGTLEPRKNLEFLLRIWPEIYTRNKVQLLIVGAKGWKYSNIFDIVNSNLIYKECVIFTGFVSDEELVKLYNAADCYVSTSLCEGFGMPQLEALLCGCPIVTADNSAMSEVASHSTLASTVRGFVPNDWIKKICEVLNNPPMELDVHSLDCYDWSVIVKKFKEYLQLLDNEI